ncbi:MAG: hypothetical protein IIA65_03015 [Planctomycetes bacterium]|nr:hypothetical protein [Planctomycetota bacterium]
MIAGLDSVEHIRGNVFDPNGDLVPQATVAVLPMVLSFQKTDETGFFDLAWSSEWCQEEMPLQVLARDFAGNQAAIVEIEDPRAEAEIWLKPAHTVRGRVLNADEIPTGLGIRNGVEYKPGVPLFISLLSGSGRILPMGSVRTDEEGNFSFEALPRGQVYLLQLSGSIDARFVLDIPSPYYQADQNTLSLADVEEDVVDLGSIAILPRAEAGRVSPRQPHSEAFQSLYGLQDGEILKLVKAPYLVERQEHSMHPRTTWAYDLLNDEFKQAVFNWNDRLRGRATVSFSWTLRSVMGIVLGMEETGLSDALERLALPNGDWVVRDDASLEQKLSALEEILQELFQRRISLADY